MDNSSTNVVEAVDSKKAVLPPKTKAKTKASKLSQPSARKSAKATATIAMTPTKVASEEAFHAESTSFQTFEDLMTKSCVT
jgi:L-arabinose isomerase